MAVNTQGHLADVLATRCPQCGAVTAMRHLDGSFVLECVCMIRQDPDLWRCCEAWLTACAAIREALARKEEAARRRMRDQRRRR